MTTDERNLSPAAGDILINLPHFNPGEIFDDIVDLAGVRVALYFPGESVQVDNIINVIFDLENNPKSFPDPSVEPPYKKRFSGYSATG